jgi:hypothetical protein
VCKGCIAHVLETRESECSLGARKKIVLFYRGKACPRFSLILIVSCLYYNADILHILKANILIQYLRNMIQYLHNMKVRRQDKGHTLNIYF